MTRSERMTWGPARDCADARSTGSVEHLPPSLNADLMMGTGPFKLLILLQVKIFGGYVRWAADLGPPDAAVPARAALAAADEAVRRASGPAAGPVHLNLQFREPLAPVPAPWPKQALAGTERWEVARRPFTSHATLPAAAWGAADSGTVLTLCQYPRNTRQYLETMCQVTHGSGFA